MAITATVSGTRDHVTAQRAGSGSVPRSMSDAEFPGTREPWGSFLGPFMPRLFAVLSRALSRSLDVPAKSLRYRSLRQAALVNADRVPDELRPVVAIAIGILPIVSG